VTGQERLARNGLACTREELIGWRGDARIGWELMCQDRIGWQGEGRLGQDRSSRPETESLELATQTERRGLNTVKL
jgi:hypothetical protein